MGRSAPQPSLNPLHDYGSNNLQHCCKHLDTELSNIIAQLYPTAVLTFILVFQCEMYCCSCVIGMLFCKPMSPIAIILFILILRPFDRNNRFVATENVNVLARIIWNFQVWCVAEMTIEVLQNS